jgi:putative spermidine/putrescine transport system permease protein
VFALGALLYFSRFSHINILHFVICLTITTLPFNIRTISASLQGIDPDLERSAKVLGADEFTAFYKILLPQIKPGLIGAFLYTFLSSFNNTTIGLFLGTPKLTTLPVRIFSEIQFHAYPSLVAAASFSMMLSFIFMLLIHKYVGISSLYK